MHKRLLSGFLAAFEYLLTIRLYYILTKRGALCGPSDGLKYPVGMKGVC